MGNAGVQRIEELLEGTPFTAVARLSAGGMGEIYEAFDHEGQRVAVKLLRAHLLGQADMVDRMRVEGEVLELLVHPNIVLGCGHGVTATGRPYVAMERLWGATLQSELRRRGALPIPEAIRATRQLLSALRAVHAAGIVHRDVKPDNVMFASGDGNARQVKLLDFGVAKIEDVPGQPIARLAVPTLAGACVGTPRYTSPEQARGASVDQRSDIYAAGIVLYTLVAGRGPFDEIKGAANVLRAHISEEPPEPSRFTPYPIPAALETVILRAIAKKPDDRFGDASSFSRELLMTLGKMCQPLHQVASPRAIERALTETRSRASTLAVPRAIRTAPVSDAAARAAAAGAGGPAVVGRRAATPAISGAEVLLSAVAFAAVASGLAMWFIH